MTLPGATERLVPAGGDGGGGVVLRCYHTPIDERRPSVLIALPLGVPAVVARAAFERLGADWNVVTWESRYILSDQEFTGDEPLGPAEHVGDMRAILGALGIGACSLIGYCSGAGVALLGAVRDPDVFTRLVLVSGEYLLFRKGHPSTDYQRSLEAFMPVAAGSREQAAFLFGKMAEIAKASGAEATRSELEQQMNLPFSREDSLYRYAKSYLALRGLESTSLAAEVRQPTLVVAGCRDVHILTESSEVISRLLPGARLVLDDEGDHYAFCRAGSRALEAIATFLAAPDPAANEDRRES